MAECRLLFSVNSCNGLYIFYLFEVVAYNLYIIYVVNIDPESALEYAVVAFDIYFLYVGIELLVYDCRYLV